MTYGSLQPSAAPAMACMTLIAGCLATPHVDRSSIPEPPKGVGKEGVGKPSTDLVSVQDWQLLLNP